ncbi:MAG: hypothetical protein ACI3XM_05570 [Eubacteriales bacterium]
MSKEKKNDRKRARIRNIVSEITDAYRNTGTSTDPEGMYTGIVQPPAADVPAVSAALAEMTAPGAGNAMTPTAAVDGGKTYRSVNGLQLERDRFEPQQDADDL